MRQFHIFQAYKYDSVAKPGLLQPLPIPEAKWIDFSMAFITGLPKLGGKDVMFVVVERFSKYNHFIPLSHPFTTIQVEKAYLNNVFKVHVWPRSIVSYKDVVSTSSGKVYSVNMLHSFFCLLHTLLKLMVKLKLLTGVGDLSKLYVQ